MQKSLVGGDLVSLVAARSQTSRRKTRHLPRHRLLIQWGLWTLRKMGPHCLTSGMMPRPSRLERQRLHLRLRPHLRRRRKLTRTRADSSQARQTARPICSEQVRMRWVAVDC